MNWRSFLKNWGKIPGLFLCARTAAFFGRDGGDRRTPGFATCGNAGYFLCLIFEGILLFVDEFVFTERG